MPLNSTPRRGRSDQHRLPRRPWQKWC